MRGLAGTLHPARVLFYVALVAPPMTVVAPRALAILLPLGAALGTVGAWRDGSLRPPPALASILVAALAGWGAASAAWAVHPDLVWSIWGQITGLAIAGLLLLGLARDIGGDERLRIGLALAAGVAAALALLFIEWASGILLERSIAAMLYAPRPFRVSIFNRAAASLAVLVWPAAHAVHLRYGRRPAIALVVTTLLIVSQFSSMAAILGLIGGGAVWIAAAWRPSRAAIVLAAVIVVGAAAAPLLPRIPALEAFPQLRKTAVSTYHRLEIWRFTADAIAERPVAGWGLNASRELPGGQELTPSGKRRMPLHPHNAFLQVWLELGLVGMAIVTLLLLAAVRGAITVARSCALAVITSGCLVAAVGYGLWQAWWMAALWIGAALVTAAPKGQAGA